MKHWKLAQYNVATMLYPRDDARVAGLHTQDGNDQAIHREA